MLTEQLRSRHAHHRTHPPVRHRVRHGGGRVRLRPDAALHFRAGQVGLLRVAGGGTKPFTFSSDERSDRISFAPTLTSGTRFKRALADLRPGDRAFTAGAIGSLPAIDPSQPRCSPPRASASPRSRRWPRSYGSSDATLLQVGTPHFFDEVAAATTAAEHHDHRAGLEEAVLRAVTDRPGARWSLSGRSGFVAAQLSGAGVPGSRIHKDTFWGMRTPAPHLGSPVAA